MDIFQIEKLTPDNGGGGVDLRVIRHTIAQIECTAKIGLNYNQTWLPAIIKLFEIHINLWCRHEGMHTHRACARTVCKSMTMNFIYYSSEESLFFFSSLHFDAFDFRCFNMIEKWKRKISFWNVGNHLHQTRVCYSAQHGNVPLLLHYYHIAAVIWSICPTVFCQKNHEPRTIHFFCT